MKTYMIKKMFLCFSEDVLCHSAITVSSAAVCGGSGIINVGCPQMDNK